MYPLLRRLLFQLEPEQAHSLTLGLMHLAGKSSIIRAILRSIFAVAGKPVQVFGLTFPNPIGLAAGYDKDGLGWRGLACLGFGHIEVGTVTPLPQAGNPPPRLFRLPAQQALINRMGFPGRGAEFVARQLRGAHPGGLVLGVNLGKGKDTPLPEAYRDYSTLMDVFAPLADYLVINVSSPNTLGLRQLQARRELEALLSELVRKRNQPSPRMGGGVWGENMKTPLLVKLSPDLNDSELDDALEVILAAGIDGVIAANTTIQRDAIAGNPLAGESGGLSGLPLRALSTQMVRKIAQRSGGKLPIIGVGGVDDAASAREKLDAGASLVQVYTGLVYRGPGLVKIILRGL